MKKDTRRRNLAPVEPQAVDVTRGLRQLPVPSHPETTGRLPWQPAPPTESFWKVDADHKA